MSQDHAMSTKFEITYATPQEDHPLPWTVEFRDANGGLICAREISPESLEKPATHGFRLNITVVEDDPAKFALPWTSKVKDANGIAFLTAECEVGGDSVQSIDVPPIVSCKRRRSRSRH